MTSYPALRALLAVLLLGLSALLAVGILAGAVSGQESPTETPTETGEEECTEHVDRFVSICSAHYDSRSGEAVLEVEADAPQSVVLTDATGVMLGGEIERQRLQVNGRSTLRMPATEFDGQVAVTLDTGRVLYAVPLEEQTRWFDGDATWETAQLAGAGAATGVLLVTGLLAYRRRDGGRSDVRRQV